MFSHRISEPAVREPSRSCREDILAQLMGAVFQLSDLLGELPVRLDLPVSPLSGQGVQPGIELGDLPVDLQGLLVEFLGLLLVLGEVGDLLGDIGRGNLLQGFAVVHTGAAGLGIELEDHPAQGGFAAAAFAYHAEFLPLIDLQGDVLHCLEVHAFAHREVFFEFVQLQEHLFLIAHLFSSSTL